LHALILVGRFVFKTYLGSHDVVVQVTKGIGYAAPDANLDEIARILQLEVLK
jgi:hypothetical protein